MWELSGVLAIVDVLTGMIPTANTDRVSPMLRGFALLHTDIILGSLAIILVLLVNGHFSGYHSCIFYFS